MIEMVMSLPLLIVLLRDLGVLLHSFPPCSVLYHYDVAIVPDKCPRRVNREIVEALVQSHADYFINQKPVFDGRKNLYSRKPLPIGRDRVRLFWVAGPASYIVSHWCLRPGSVIA